ncbi:MAG TPA: hemerythrin domain-containing protein [Mycobacteriales bacterium]
MTLRPCPAPGDLPPAVVDEVPVDDLLAGQHAVLLRNVARRVHPIVALLEARVWPHAELETLTRFLRTSVLRQVSDEETLLYPADASAPPFAELTTDHVRLHTLNARLEAALVVPCNPVELRGLLGDLVETLERHLRAEQDVLAALHWSDADPDRPVVIRLDAVPEGLATDRCIERLLRLRPGQSAELHAEDGRQLEDVGRWLRRFDSAGFGLSDVVTDRTDAVLQISRRQDA